MVPGGVLLGSQVGSQVDRRDLPWSLLFQVLQEPVEDRRQEIHLVWLFSKRPFQPLFGTRLSEYGSQQGLRSEVGRSRAGSPAWGPGRRHVRLRHFTDGSYSRPTETGVD